MIRRQALATFLAPDLHRAIDTAVPAREPENGSWTTKVYQLDRTAQRGETRAGRSTSVPGRYCARDAVALIVGIVVGAGIFRTPSLVAANASSTNTALLAWLLGGACRSSGALCYAELATTYPHAGGDYHYLRRAFGQRLAFLFAWARISVIQTGSIALLAFVFGDYAAQLLPLGAYSSSLYAALAVIVLTGLNMLAFGTARARRALLTVVEVAGVLLIIVTGLFFAAPSRQSSEYGASARRRVVRVGDGLRTLDLWWLERSRLYLGGTP